MRRILGSIVIGVVFAAAGGFAQSGATPGAPFRLGTFEANGRTFVGIVVGDALVADLEQAFAATQDANGASTSVPRDMTDLIVRYDAAMEARLLAIAKAAAAQPRPAYARELASVTVRPPIMYPRTILNAAVNYAEHGAEMAGTGVLGPETTPLPTIEAIPGIWQRKPDDVRQNPYLFVKPASAVIGDGEAIQLPPGRDRIDWECEIAVVIGRTASRVPPDRAQDYIFGYTLENDVSDRGGRADRRHGSDWLLGKGHDTFAPLGPFIVPKAYVPNAQALRQRFLLNGTVMQDSNTDRMTHTIAEIVSYASHILTLRPGDVVAMGSPAGVGTARATPIYFKPGDTAVCTIDGIGTLTNPVVAAPAVASRR